MSHSDTIDQLPDGGSLLASTDDVKNAAFCIDGETTFGIQFHPEVYHTTDGKNTGKLFDQNCQNPTKLDSRLFCGNDSKTNSRDRRR